MTRNERLRLKNKIDAFGRADMAGWLRMPYSTLSGKVNGYIAFTDVELEDINRILEISGGKL